MRGIEEHVEEQKKEEGESIHVLFNLVCFFFSLRFFYLQLMRKWKSMKVHD